jgi:hypothetical protein
MLVGDSAVGKVLTFTAAASHSHYSHIFAPDLLAHPVYMQGVPYRLHPDRAYSTQRYPPVLTDTFQTFGGHAETVMVGDIPYTLCVFDTLGPLPFFVVIIIRV